MDYIKEFVKRQRATTNTTHKNWTKEQREKNFRDFWDFAMMFYHPQENPQELKLQLAQLKKWKANNNKKKNLKEYYFITVCPPEHIDWKVSLKQIKKLMSWSCWTDVIGVIEQRSSNQEFYGVHYHVLAKKSGKYLPSNVKQRLDRIKKKWNTDVQVIEENFARDKQAYLFEKWGKTKSTGEPKAVVMEMDELFRKKNKLPRFFGKKIFEDIKNVEKKSS